MTESSSGSIYDLIQNHRISTFNNNTNIPKRRILSERFKIIAVISSISVVIMAGIVITYIALQYARNKRIKLSESMEQRTPLYTSRNTAHRSKTNDDRRNVGRKTKKLSTPATTFV